MPIWQKLNYIQEMGYEYDIFLSYNRKHPHGQWVNDIFYPLVIPYIEDATNKEVKVFKDDREILSGAQWERTILRALLKSRMMISILSPSYFMSEWCKKEFQIMHYRQIQLGFMSDANPNGIIVPIRINDGDFFPKCVSKIQSLDCRNYFRIGEGFKATPRFVELQDRLLSWSNDVAKAVEISPKWSTDWSNREWIDNSFLTIDLNTIEHKTQPIL
jgi:hypothetical protein